MLCRQLPTVAYIHEQKLDFLKSGILVMLQTTLLCVSMIPDTAGTRIILKWLFPPRFPDKTGLPLAVRMLYWLLQSSLKQKSNRLVIEGGGSLGVAGGNWGRPGALQHHRQPPPVNLKCLLFLNWGVVFHSLHSFSFPFPVSTITLLVLGRGMSAVKFWAKQATYSSKVQIQKPIKTSNCSLFIRQSSDA